MHLRISSSLALVVALAGFTGCSGGGAGAAGASIRTCDGSLVNALCLSSCSLGCRGARCEITEIAQNENVVLVFSSPVDPTSVNSSSIRFRTAAGEEPVGTFLVHDAVVEFVPQLLVVGGQSYFGFRAGETYTMSLPGGASEINAVRSTAGDRLKDTITCSVNVSRGIVDLNQAPPSARLVSPSVISNVPNDVTIQLEFNEVIDVTPFLGTTAANGPVTFGVRRTRENTSTQQRECNPLSPIVALAGTPRVDMDTGRGISVVTFRPAQPLPSNICVEISVTDRVKDLSGKPAQPQVFQFRTVEQVTPEQNIAEEFVDDSKLDRDLSSGQWVGGRAAFAQVGGDGAHGEFSPELGAYQGLVNGKHTYLFNTDNTVIPGSNTITGNPIAVTDGKFRFSKMFVPLNTRLIFTGSNPPQFLVRGRLEIDGIIDVRGADNTYYSPTTTTVPGQPGGAAGIYGGRGGNGGDKCNGLGAVPANNGQNGQDCNVLVGHAFAASRVGTGGRGSSIFPLAGTNASILFNTGTVPYSLMATAGGSGGGYVGAGGVGRVIYNTRSEARSAGTVTAATTTTLVDSTRASGGAGLPWVPGEWVGMRVAILTGAVPQNRLVVANTESQLTVDSPWAAVPTPNVTTYQLPLVSLMGAPVAAGISLPDLLSSQGTTRSSLHFLIGGSGGGGAGSQPLFCNSFQPGWAAGCGGGGGGGVIAMRAGNVLRINAAAQVLANGGGAGQSSGAAVTSVTSAPAGGGSGGSVLLQTGNQVDIQGLVDVRGGVRGYLNRATNLGPPQGGGTVEIGGGAGAPGFVRLEVIANPSPSLLPNVQPPATATNVGLLGETDGRVGFQSLFYSLNQPFGPEFLRYEITAVVNGQTVVYSDAPLTVANYAGPARFGSAPIEAYFQAGSIDTTTNEVDPATIQPWRNLVGSFGGPSLADDALNAFRFQILFDRLLGQTVEIESVKVFYRI